MCTYIQGGEFWNVQTSRNLNEEMCALGEFIFSLWGIWFQNSVTFWNLIGQSWILICLSWHLWHPETWNLKPEFVICCVATCNVLARARNLKPEIRIRNLLCSFLGFVACWNLKSEICTTLQQGEIWYGKLSRNVWPGIRIQSNPRLGSEIRILIVPEICTKHQEM